MKNKSDGGNCSRCGKEITDNNFGDSITAEEVIVCDSCAEKHKLSIIAELNKFRQSKEYNDRLALKEKILWGSESLGHIYDNGTGTIRESISDYDNLNIFELQLYVIEIELLCVEDLLRDNDSGLPTINNPKLNKLRKMLKKCVEKPIT